RSDLDPTSSGCSLREDAGARGDVFGSTRVLPRPNIVTSTLISLRPRQWIKNLFVFAAVIFSQNLFTPSVWRAVGAFVVFCGLSGAIYLINDVADREKDRLHPLKRRRPVASGALPWRLAAVIGTLLLLASLAAAFALSWRFGIVAAVYGALLVGDSLWLKSLVILDVLTVAIGVVVRGGGGAGAVGVVIFGWAGLFHVTIAPVLAL